MRFAAGLTITGVLGYLVMEALKILLAPVAVWLLGVVMLVTKVLLMTLGIAVLLGIAAAGYWAYRRWSESSDGMAA